MACRRRKCCFFCFSFSNLVVTTMSAHACFGCPHVGNNRQIEKGGSAARVKANVCCVCLPACIWMPTLWWRAATSTQDCQPNLPSARRPLAMGLAGDGGVCPSGRFLTPRRAERASRPPLQTSAAAKMAAALARSAGFPAPFRQLQVRYCFCCRHRKQQF